MVILVTSTLEISAIGEIGDDNPIHQNQSSIWRAEMFSLAMHTQQPPHVMALFNDGAEAFLLSKGATLAELAEFIDELQSRHDGAPVAVNVQFVPPGLPAMTRKPLREAIPSRGKQYIARMMLDG